MPIVHVNADDPIACLAATRLATAYRARFGQDFLVDLIGYRRWGHNEGDDPSFTQPRTYAAVEKKPTVRETVSLYEAKTHLSELVERAAQGAEIVISKSGKPKPMSGTRGSWAVPSPVIGATGLSAKYPRRYASL